MDPTIMGPETCSMSFYRLEEAHELGVLQKFCVIEREESLGALHCVPSLLRDKLQMCEGKSNKCAGVRRILLESPPVS